MSKHPAVARDEAPILSDNPPAARDAGERDGDLSVRLHRDAADAAITGLAVVFSFGPMYLLAVGLTLPEAAFVTALAFGGTTIGSYYLFVWAARPDHRKQIPGPVRLQRVYYAVFAAIALVGLLALPLLT